MDLTQHLTLARYLSKLLDNQFRFGNMRFGLDPLLGIFPVIGDFIPTIVAGYIIWLAVKLDVSRTTIFQMIWHVVLDLLIGMIPVIGDLADFTYKASSKNLTLLERALDLQHPEKVVASSNEKNSTYHS